MGIGNTVATSWDYPYGPYLNDSRTEAVQARPLIRFLSCSTFTTTDLPPVTYMVTRQANNRAAMASTHPSSGTVRGYRWHSNKLHGESRSRGNDIRSMLIIHGCNLDHPADYHNALRTA